MLEVLGMKELLKKLDEVSEAPEKVSKKALQKAGNHVKDVEVEVAKREHKRAPQGYSQDVGWKELKRYNVKKNKKGNQVIDIGMRATLTASQKKKDKQRAEAGESRPTYWDRVRGLWFNNWGFYHNLTGKYVAGSDWIGKAYDESVDEAYAIIRAEIIKEMRL